MGFLALSGLVMTAAMLVTLARVVHWRFILGYATLIDVTATVGLLTLYAGTYSGMMAATISGLVLAVTLSAGRKIFGYSRLNWQMQTVHYPGVLTDLENKAGDKANAYCKHYSRYVECVRNYFYGPVARFR